MDPVIITSEGENPKSHIVAIRGASPNWLYNGLIFVKEKEKKKKRRKDADTRTQKKGIALLIPTPPPHPQYPSEKKHQILARLRLN